MKGSVEETGMKEAYNRLMFLRNKISVVVGGGLNRVCRDGAKRSVPNTPIDTGALRSSIHAAPVIVEGVKGEGGITADVDYAFKMHEGNYGLGPKSAAQPGTPEGGVGPRYISRVVEAHALSTWIKIWEEWCAQVLK